MYFGLAFLALRASAVPHYKRAAAYYNPADQGGSMLTDAGDLGEPLNVSSIHHHYNDLIRDPCRIQVIISGYSSPDVLTDDGIVNYARAIGLSVYSRPLTIPQLTAHRCPLLPAARQSA